MSKSSSLLYTMTVLIVLMNVSEASSVSTLQQLLKGQLIQDRILHTELQEQPTAHLSPRIVAPLADSLTSDAWATLEVSPSSPLFAGPGEETEISFVLNNRANVEKTFVASVTEDAFSDPSGSRLSPSSRFVVSLSESRPKLGAGESKVLRLLLNIPSVTPIGTLRLLTLRVQSTSLKDSSSEMVRRVFFRVGNSDDTDNEPPVCVVSEDDQQLSCDDSDQVECGDHNDQGSTWSARFRIRDAVSGLRSLSFIPSSLNSSLALYSSDNFVVGSISPANVFFTARCCFVSTASIVVSDVAGNEIECEAGKHVVADPIVSDNMMENNEEKNKENIVGTAGMTAVLVIVAVLVVVLVGLVVALLLLKRRRRAELAEMRASPQER